MPCSGSGFARRRLRKMRDSGPQRDGRIGLGWIGRWAVGRGGRRRVRSEGGEEVRHRHRQRALAVWHACCAPTVIHTYPPRDVLPAPQLCTHARPICEPTVAARSRNLTWSVVVPFPRAPARLLRLLTRPALSPDSRRRCIPEPAPAGPPCATRTRSGRPRAGRGISIVIFQPAGAQHRSSPASLILPSGPGRDKCSEQSIQYLFNVTRTAVGWAVLGCQRGYGGCDVDGIESTSAGGWRLAAEVQAQPAFTVRPQA